MEKVTYLFGAGASALCLPTVNAIPKRMKKFLLFIQGNLSYGNEMLYGKHPLSKIELDFAKECEDIIEKVEKHQSIDTYAKKLRITARDDKFDVKYGKLKSILSCFFIYEQLVNKTDERYDGFFASIINDHSTDFAQNLRILSWNYDFQFEKAYSEYSLKKSLVDNQNDLNVFPSARRVKDYDNTFSIFKLNGTTGFYDKEKRSVFHLHDEFDVIDKKALVKQFMLNYVGCYKGVGKIRPLLSFAWEKDWHEETTELLETARNAIKGTETLVILGYSIPFFNREVDRYILEEIYSTTTAIYIQDKLPDIVSQRVSSIWHGPTPPIHLISDVNQFYLPPKL